MTRPRWLSPAEARAWLGYRRMRTLLDLQIARDLAKDRMWVPAPSQRGPGPDGLLACQFIRPGESPPGHSRIAGAPGGAG